jgi:hypothetical protein
MIPVIAIAGWVILVAQIAGLCLAASRGERSLQPPRRDRATAHGARSATPGPASQAEAGTQG